MQKTNENDSVDYSEVLSIISINLSTIATMLESINETMKEVSR